MSLGSSEMGNCLAWHAARRLRRRYPPQVRAAATHGADADTAELVFESPRPVHVIGSSGHSDDDEDDEDDRDADARHEEDSLAMARRLAEGAADVVEAHFAAHGSAPADGNYRA